MPRGWWAVHTPGSASTTLARCPNTSPTGQDRRKLHLFMCTPCKAEGFLFFIGKRNPSFWLRDKSHVSVLATACILKNWPRFSSIKIVPALLLSDQPDYCLLPNSGTVATPRERILSTFSSWETAFLQTLQHALYKLKSTQAPWRK